MTVDATRLVEHGGVPLLYVDLRGRDRAEMLERIAAMREAVAACAPGSALVLTECADAYFDAEVIRTLGEAVVANKRFVRARAVVGLSPEHDAIRQLIAGMTAEAIEPFDDIEAAKDWLAAQGPAGPA